MNCFRKVGFHDVETELGLEQPTKRWPMTKLFTTHGETCKAMEPPQTTMNLITSCTAVTASKELTDDAITSAVRGDLQDEYDSEPDEHGACNVPSRREVVDTMDVSRRFACTQQDKNVMQAIGSANVM